jgi:hypothetical protein
MAVVLKLAVPTSDTESLVLFGSFPPYLSAPETTREDATGHSG